eukprot:5168735-Pyramimonas_sp.AAC.1
MAKYLSNNRQTTGKLPHCPPRPGGPTSFTPRRNSSSSSMSKSSTRYAEELYEAFRQLAPPCRRIPLSLIP